MKFDSCVDLCSSEEESEDEDWNMLPWQRDVFSASSDEEQENEEEWVLQSCQPLRYWRSSPLFSLYFKTPLGVEKTLAIFSFYYPKVPYVEVKWRRQLFFVFIMGKGKCIKLALNKCIFCSKPSIIMDFIVNMAPN